MDSAEEAFATRDRAKTRSEVTKFLSLKYFAGFFFTRDVILYLLKHGLATNKAVNLLVTNPPTSLEDLRRAEEFAKGLKRLK